MRRFGALLAAAGLTCVACAARAAEQKEGMPQLDFNNPMTLSQVVWLGIIFLVFYILLSNWALPKVAEVLQLRASTIAQDLDAARAAKAEADTAVAELTAATKTAHVAAQAQIADALAKAKADAAAQAAGVNAKLDAQIAQAEQRIATARASGLSAVKQVATEAAIAMVGRLADVTPNVSAIESAVVSALAAHSIPVG